MSVSAVVFDFDGTLIDSASFSVAILNQMLASRGSKKRVSVQSIQKSLSLGGEALMQDALDAGPEAAAAELKQFRTQLGQLQFPLERLYPETVASLDALKAAGVRLAICTKKPVELTLKTLRDLGLSETFEVVSGGDSEQFAKPDARHLHAVLEKMKIAADGVLFVGDSHVDAELAHNANVRFVFATYGYDDGSVKRGECFAVVHSMRELVALAASL